MQPTPITLEELATITTWEQAQDFANRGINEIRSLRSVAPGLQDAARQSRDAFQANQDRQAELARIMQALVAKGPELQ